MPFLQNAKLYFYSFQVLGIIIITKSLMDLRASVTGDLNSSIPMSILVSFIAFCIGFIPLCYISWIKDKEKTVMYYLKQVFFWLTTAIILSACIYIGLLINGLI